jgi:hypothetical protein
MGGQFHYDEARELFNEILTLEPDHDFAQYHLASLTSMIASGTMRYPA